MKVRIFTRISEKTVWLFLGLLAGLLLLPQLSFSTPAVQDKISLEEAFHRIGEKYDVFFNYDRSIAANIRVDYEVKQHHSLDDAMDYVLKNTNLGYRIFDERFVVVFQNNDQGIESLKEMIGHVQGFVDERETVKKRKVKPVRRLTTLSANELYHKRLVFSVSGTVTDEAGEPLIGVNIQVKGTETGTATDIDGTFTLEYIDENAVLVVSYVGYQTQEIAVAGKSNLTITMVLDSQLLDEVVVVGYGSVKKVNLTGAVSNVTSKVLENRPITNIGQGLEGTVSNLNITPGNGSLGKGSSFNIRGYTSINGGSPLILVDGIPMDINQLNPNDIDNVTVLKDAASAAIYGARAAYGVILVTTKSGKKGMGKPRISFRSFFATNEPTSKFHMADSKDRVAYMNEAYLRTQGRNYYDDKTMTAILAHYNDPSQPEAILLTEDANKWTGVANTDWEKILMNDSYPMHQHTASVSGGSDRFDYYTSLSYLNQKGLVNKNLFDEHFNRYNFMTSLNYHVHSWITIGTKITVDNSNKRFPPLPSLFPENGTMYFKRTYSTLPFKSPIGTWTNAGSILNPAQALIEGGYRTRDINDLWLTGLIKLTPIKNVTFNLDYSSNIENQKELTYTSLIPFYDVNGEIYGYQKNSNPNSVIKTNYNNKYFVFNAYGDYSNTFNKRHFIKALIGFNQENAQYNWNEAERRNLIIDAIPYLNLASGISYTGDGINEYAIRGAFSRVNYVFDDRYLFEFNGRYDGSSKFPKNNRFAFFPSASVGWRVDNEKFFAGLKKNIDQLKFRASYGSLGNQNVAGYYPYIAPLSAAEVKYIIGGGLPVSVYAPGLVSSSLTWETVKQKNLGVDFAFFNSRLSGSFDIYKRDTKNMLTKSRTLPAVLAVGEPKANAADLSTTGFDLNLSWTDIINKDIRYEVTAVLSDHTAKITRYDNPAGLISDYYVGGRLGDIWGLTTGGLFQTDEEAEALDQSNIDGRKRQAGDLWMVDLNKDNKITKGSRTIADPGDLSIIGNSTPRYSFGFRTSIGWKGFDLDLFLQGVAKRDLWMNTNYFLYQYNTQWGAIPKIGMDYWSPENPDAYFPRPIIKGKDILNVQTRFMQNAAYIRLKQLTFSYTIPVNLTKKAGIERIRVFFSGSNLWTGTNMVKISDPELGGPTNYPLYTSLSLGANIDL